jgi:hypothetical protein
MTLTIDLTPSEEARIEVSARNNGITPADVVKRLLNEHLPSTSSVADLLTKWQQQYGLPARPDGKVHTSFRELLDQWQEEDALLTPDEVAEQERLWDDWRHNQEGISI